MKKYLKNIEKQIAHNQGKNLFLKSNRVALRFADETKRSLSALHTLTAEEEEILIHYSADKALEEFCRINQYFSFNSHVKEELRSLYREIFASIKQNKESIESLEKRHFENLKEWLLKSNPFAEKLYAEQEAAIIPVACSEYSEQLQISLLQIDMNTLVAPVLDIGCGKKGALVNYLNERGFETYGLDRFSLLAKNTINTDWLEYDYGIERWGTIISNLGFSNHFMHQNLRDDGNYLDYATKYMEILRSLKTGGKFHYAPDLPFIEKYLDPLQYQVKNHDVGEFGYKTSVIQRLR